jgi:hypothetical protein
MTEQGFPVFKVAQILDKTTLVITGAGVGKLLEGAELLVLALGREIDDPRVPLILPKEQLRTTLVTDAYAIARPPVTAVEDPISSLFGTMPKVVQKRLPFDVKEDQLVGNPARLPVEVGDPVIQPQHFRAFVALKAQELQKRGSG